MGKILGNVFGSHSSGKNVSKNLAFPMIQQQFGGATGATGQSTNALSNLLGLGDGGGPAQDAAFQKFRDNSGYDFQKEQGIKAIEGSQAARGMLNSGATLKSLDKFGQGLASSSLDSYLQNIFKLGNLGLGAGNLLASAGQYSQGKQRGEGKGGLGNALGTAASMISLSDRRLKKNIKKVGELDNGLNVYTFEYTYKPGLQRGVMADEVALIQPEALGPMLDGYQTVDYSKIGAV